MREVIPRLKAAGATGIVEYPLSKVVLVDEAGYRLDGFDEAGQEGG